MTTAAHTPGPWMITGGDSTTAYIDDAFGDEGGRNYYLAEVSHGDPGELKANACLIAAAPDLLAALLAAVKAGIIDIDGEPDVARAAIARATGTAP